MIINQIISQTRKVLLEKTKKVASESQRHSVAFALRIFDKELIRETGLDNILGEITGDIAYGGYPEVSELGYKIAVSKNNELFEIFLGGLRRQKNRSPDALETLSSDDIALLGIAEGLVVVKKEDSSLNIEDLQKWILDLINLEPKRKIWTSRLRDLAGDLLDGKRRLSSLPDLNDINIAALEIVLRNTWPEQINNNVFNREFFEDLLSDLITHADPKIKQIEETALWLVALDLLTKQNSKFLFAKTEIAISLLEAVKKKLDEVALNNTKISFIFWASLILVVNIVYFLIREQLPTNYQDRLNFLVPLISVVLGYIYQAFSQKKFNPKTIFLLALEKNKFKLYKRWGFDIERYKKLL